MQKRLSYDKTTNTTKKIKHDKEFKRRIEGLKVIKWRTLTLLACGRTTSEAADPGGDSEKGQELAVFPVSAGSLASDERLCRQMSWKRRPSKTASSRQPTTSWTGVDALRYVAVFSCISLKATNGGK